jgi:hypothetical protein
LHIFVAHLPVFGVGHHGEQHAAVVTDAFADGADQLAVGEAGRAGFRVAGEIGRHDRAWAGQRLALAQASLHDRIRQPRFVGNRMARDAALDGKQILPTRHALGGSFHLNGRRRAHVRRTERKEGKAGHGDGRHYSEDR